MKPLELKCVYGLDDMLTAFPSPVSPDRLNICNRLDVDGLGPEIAVMVQLDLEGARALRDYLELFIGLQET